MNRERIGLLLIGQTPRPDLTAPLDHLAGAYDLVVRGALDALTASDLKTSDTGTYPLVTRMRDGTVVTVDERFLTLLRLKPCYPERPRLSLEPWSIKHFALMFSTENRGVGESERRRKIPRLSDSPTLRLRTSFMPKARCTKRHRKTL